MKIINLIENTKGQNNCLFEHGLSFYIETKKHKLLVDTGASDAFIENAERLGIDLTKVDTVILSHGHYDHTGGVLAFAKQNPQAKIYMQRKASEEFYNVTATPEKYIGIDKEILNLPQLVLLDGDCEIDEELYLFANVTGRTLWPQGNQMLKRKVGEEFVQDDFSHEQYLVITADTKRWLVSGCAHNGILNILDHYRNLFGANPYAVISGFHMRKKTEYTNQDDSIVQETAERLKQMDTMFYTGHCTGEHPYELMKEVLKEQLVYVHSGDCIMHVN